MISKNTGAITISKAEVREKGGVVVLSLKEYEELKRQAVPTYQLYGKEAEDLDMLVRDGLRDYTKGKTRKIDSLADLD